MGDLFVTIDEKAVNLPAISACQIKKDCVRRPNPNPQRVELGLSGLDLMLENSVTNGFPTGSE